MIHDRTRTAGFFILVLLSVVFFLPGHVSAKQQNSLTTKQQIAFRYFDRIMRIGNMPGAQNMAQNRAWQYRQTQVLVYGLAERIGDRNDHTTPREVAEALDALMDVSGYIADKYMGNRNGSVEQNEVESMATEGNNYVGLGVIMVMYFQSRQLKHYGLIP